MIRARYSFSESQKILSNLKHYSFEELNILFKDGSVPIFHDFKGATAGSFLAENPINPFGLARMIKRIFFGSFWAKWTGKLFDTPFSEKQNGRGVNIFANRLFPHRFSFDTYIKRAFLDGNLCLVLDYRPYFSIMAGLVDDVRQIQGGVLLGQMHYYLPFKKKPWFVGYFALCALSPLNS